VGNNLEFQFGANLIKADLSEDKDLIIEGIAVDTSVNENKWAVPEDELESLTTQFNAKRQVRVDHSKSFRDIVGYIEKAERDGSKIKFRARIHDPIIQKIILKNPTAHYVSIGALAEDVKCSKCEKASKPFRTCKCEGAHDIVRKLKLRELSFITDPAYESTEFQPVGFFASVTSAIDKFAPKREYKCEKELNEVEERACRLIKEYNPGTHWNLAAAKELYPDYTDNFLNLIQGNEVASATDTEIKRVKKMSEKLEKLEKEIKAAEEEIKKKEHVAPPETHMKKGEDEKAKDVKDTEKEEGTKSAGPDSVMILSEKFEELTRKMEELRKAEEHYHEEDEVKKRESSVAILSKRVGEMVKKVEELTKTEELYHKKMEKDDEDEKEKKASSEKYDKGAKVAPERSVTTDSGTLMEAAWAEIIGGVKKRKPEWDI